jgi:hypothetical protein
MAGEFGAPEVGLPVLMCAGELAAVLQASEHHGEIPASLAAVSEQAVTTTTLSAAGCLAGLVDTSRQYPHSPAKTRLG